MSFKKKYRERFYAFKKNKTEIFVQKKTLKCQV